MKTHAAKPNHKLRTALLILLGVCLLLAAAGVGVLYYLGRDLPDVGSLGQALNTPSLRIVDRSGRLLYEAFPATGGRHTVVELKDIPPALRQATIATEDASFYQNPGVDLWGILRAAWINLNGGEVLAGGSTITQQVARHLLLSEAERSERTLTRKLREMLLAWNLARSLPKDQVLALYLNQMYYGSLAYGVEAASQTYFGKPAAELDLAEAALLAGLPQSPAAYDPFQHPEAAKARQATVLDLMQKAGMLSPEQRALAAAEPLVYNPQPYPILAPHFVMMVRQQAADLVAADEIYRLGGITVRTTLDLDWQQHAEQAVAHQVERLRQQGQLGVSFNVNDAALVALDPASGQVLAMVGSADYFDEGISGAVNMALAPRQPGSALKPFIYAAAFDPDQPQPWTPATMILDVTTNFTTHDGKAYTPANYDQLEHGPVLARQALASSLNIPAVKTLQKVGLPRLFTLAGALGIDSLGDPDQYDLSLALGGGEVSLLQLTSAYAALAEGGVKVTPQAILDIEDPQGNIIYTPAPAARPQVIDPRAAWLVSDILSDDSARELGFGRNSVLQIGRPAAVKTGTTTNFHDNWTVGYTPDLVVGVWAGNADYSAMHNVNGLTGAAPIWAEFMRTVLAGRPESGFSRPAGLAQAQVCALSGLLPSADCPYRRTEWFIDGTQPVRTDTVYRPVEIDLASGRLADASTPPERRTQRLALDLPPAAAAWAAANHQVLYASLGGEIKKIDDGPQTTHDGGQTTHDGGRTEGGGVTTGEGGVQFLAPADRAIYHLAAGSPAGAQRVQVQVSAAAELGGVTLWIDEGTAGGSKVALSKSSSTGYYEYWWPLEVGVHKLKAEAGGETAEITVEVK